MATNLTPPWNLLGPAARAEWRRTTRWLAARGILHDLDQNLLIAYAIAWERYLEAEVKVQELGQVIRTDRGDEVLNPWLKISDQARVRQVPERTLRQRCQGGQRVRAARESGACERGHERSMKAADVLRKT